MLAGERSGSRQENRLYARISVEKWTTRGTSNRIYSHAPLKGYAQANLRGSNASPLTHQGIFRRGQEFTGMDIGVQEPSTGQVPENYLPEEKPDGHEPNALEALLEAMERMRNGDFSARLPVAWTGLP